MFCVVSDVPLERHGLGLVVLLNEVFPFPGYAAVAKVPCE